MMSFIKIIWIWIAISCTIEAYQMKGKELEELKKVSTNYNKKTNFLHSFGIINIAKIDIPEL